MVRNFPYMFAGIDEGETNPMLTKGLLTLQDGIFTKNGELEKRYATSIKEAASSTQAISSLNSYIIHYKTSDNKFHYGTKEITNNLTWTDIKSEEMAGVYGGNEVILHVDRLTSGNVTIIVSTSFEWGATTMTLDLTVLDANTGVKLSSMTLANGYMRTGQIFKANNILYVVYRNSSGAWELRTVSATGIISSSYTSCPTAMGGSTYYWQGTVVTTTAGTEKIIISYFDGTVYRIGDVLGGSDSSIGVTPTTEGPTTLLYWYTDYVAYGYTDLSTGIIYVVSIKYDGTGSSSPTLMLTYSATSDLPYNLSLSLSSTNLTMFATLSRTRNYYQTYTGYPQLTATWSQYNLSSYTVGAQQFKYGVSIISRPIQINYKDVGLISVGQDKKNDLSGLRTALLFDYTNKRVIGKTLVETLVIPNPDQGGSLRWGFPIHELKFSSTNVYHHVLPVRKASNKANVSLTIVNFNPTVHAYKTSKAVYFDGSYPRYFGGASLTEWGFIDIPESDAVIASGTALGIGAYSYKVIYEWYNDAGDLVRSQSGVASTVTTTTGNQNVTVYYKTPTQTDKNDVKTVIYRTLLDGLVHYKLKTISSTSFEGRWYSFNDSSSDSSISSNELIYTDQGILDYQPIQPFSVGSFESDRFFYVPRDKRTFVYYSNTKEDEEGFSFTGVGEIYTNPEDGDITGISSFGNKIIVFHDSTISVYPGEGINKAGALIRSISWGDYTIKISNSIGARDNKILHTKAGLVFTDARLGIHALNASSYGNITVKDFGAKVKYLTDQNSYNIPMIQKSLDAIIFYGNSKTLVYFMKYGAWVEWTGFGVVSEGVTQIDDNIFTFGSSNIYQTASTKYTGALKIQTPWFSFAGINGYSRLKYLYLNGMIPSSNLSIILKSAYNFDKLYFSTDTHTTALFSGEEITDSDYYDTAGTVATVETFTPLMVKWIPHKQTCSSVRFMIDITTSDIKLNGITFGIQTKKGGAKLGSTRRM